MVIEQYQQESVGEWSKNYYFAARTVIESILRNYGLGPTQWYVLYELINEGPTKQSDLSRMLKIERATLSNVVASLVRKNLIDKASYSKDQRQRVLIITDLGTKLWEGFPLHTTRHGVEGVLTLSTF